MYSSSTRFLLALILVGTLIPSYFHSAAGSLQVFATPTGVQSVIVIPVQFPDLTGSVSLQEPLDRLLMRLNEYYVEVSYGKVRVESNVLRKWIMLPNQIGFYGTDSLGPGDDSGGNRQGSWQIVVDAVLLVDPEVDFSKYENFIIMHAGNDQAKTSPRKVTSEIWSKTFWNQPFPVRTKDGVNIDKASIVSETSALGIWAHEFAHQIGFLPDLYNAQDPEDHFVGPWSLMDAGSNLGNPPGSMPSHLDSWSKIKLGWLIPATSLGREGEFVLGPLELDEGIRALQIPLSRGTYYLLELRKKIGFDSSLPDEGVLIYFVDEAVGSGQGPVRLVDANDETLTLKDAAFPPGTGFTDERNKVFISILRGPAGLVRIRISSELTLTLSIEAPQVLPIFQYTLANVQVTPSIPNLQLEVYMDGSLYRSFTTGVNGTYSIPLFFDASKIGTHTLRAVLIDRAQNLNIEASAQVNVEIPGYIWAVLVSGVIIAILSVSRLVRGRPTPVG